MGGIIMRKTNTIKRIAITLCILLCIFSAAALFILHRTNDGAQNAGIDEITKQEVNYAALTAGSEGTQVQAQPTANGTLSFASLELADLSVDYSTKGLLFKARADKEEYLALKTEYDIRFGVAVIPALLLDGELTAETPKAAFIKGEAYEDGEYVSYNVVIKNIPVSAYNQRFTAVGIAELAEKESGEVVDLFYTQSVTDSLANVADGIYGTAEGADRAVLDEIIAAAPEISATDFELKTNESKSISVALFSNGANVASANFYYKSEDPEVATVTSDGTVTGVAYGSTKISIGAVGYPDTVTAVEVSVAKPSDYGVININDMETPVATSKPTEIQTEKNVEMDGWDDVGNNGFVKLYSQSTTQLPSGSVDIAYAFNFEEILQYDLEDSDYFSIRFFIQGVDTSVTGDRWGQKVFARNLDTFNWIENSLPNFRPQVNAWTEYKLTVSEIRTMAELNKINDCVFFGFRVNPSDNPSPIATIYFDDIRFVTGTKTVPVSQITDLSLPEFGTELTYSFEIKKDSAILASGSNENTEYTFLSTGIYTVEYNDIKGIGVDASTWQTTVDVKAQTLADGAVVATPSGNYIFAKNMPDPSITVEEDTYFGTESGKTVHLRSASNPNIASGNMDYVWRYNFAQIFELYVLDEADYFTLEIYYKSEVLDNTNTRWQRNVFVKNEDLGWLGNTNPVGDQRHAVNIVAEYKLTVPQIRTAYNLLGADDSTVWFNVRINPNDAPKISDIYFGDIVYHKAG